MKVLTYRIVLQEPALVTGLVGDPNSAVAESHLPGSVLRGALIGRYLRASGRKELDAANGAERRLFLSGETRFLNGYPTEQERRTLPVPLSWHREKGAERPIYDFAF